MIYIAKQGEMLDEIVGNHYGRTRGYTEAVLEANYRLEEMSPVLSLGQKVILPDGLFIDNAEPVVRLWD